MQCACCSMPSFAKAFRLFFDLWTGCEPNDWARYVPLMRTITSPSFVPFSDGLWNILINYTNNRTPEHPNIRESCHSQKGCQIPVTTVPTTWDSTMRKPCNGTTRLKHTWEGIRNWWLMRYMWCFYSVDSPFFGASNDRILMVCNTLIGCCDVGFCTLHSVWHRI